MAKAKTVGVPPLPKLKWDGYAWSGEVTLPSWAGFEERRGSYGSRSSRKPSTGKVSLRVGGEVADESRPPTKAMAAAYAHLLKNEAAIAKAILRAVADEYERYKRENSEMFDDEDDAERTMPKLKSPNDLQKHIGLHTVHILDTESGGVAYVGFEFGCTWEEEHGLGVMTHRSRVASVGGADESFMEWIAEADAKKRKPASKKKRPGAR